MLLTQRATARLGLVGRRQRHSCHAYAILAVDVSTSSPRYRGPALLTMSKPMTRSATKIAPGKSTPAVVVKCLSVSSVMAQFMKPMKKTRGDSVLGASHDFRMVGRAAT